MNKFDELYNRQLDEIKQSHGRDFDKIKQAVTAVLQKKGLSFIERDEDVSDVSPSMAPEDKPLWSYVWELDNGDGIYVTKGPTSDDPLKNSYTAETDFEHPQYRGSAYFIEEDNLSRFIRQLVKDLEIML